MYYTTREANDNMLKSPQGIHNFLGLIILKKLETNKRPFKSWSNRAIQSSEYYIMHQKKYSRHLEGNDIGL